MRFLFLSVIPIAFFAGTTLASDNKAPADARAAQTDSRRKMEESVAKQKEALRKQAGPPSGDGFFTTGWIGPPPAAAAAPPACDRLGEEQVAPMIVRAATESKIDPELVRAVVRRESSFVPCAVSAKGALGMMQLMPDTATRFEVADPFDAAQNIAAGAKYLKELLDRFGGKVDLALAGYNAGPQAVEQANGQVPDIAETRDYVKAIMEALSATEKPVSGRR